MSCCLSALHLDSTACGYRCAINQDMAAAAVQTGTANCTLATSAYAYLATAAVCVAAAEAGRRPALAAWSAWLPLLLRSAPLPAPPAPAAPLPGCRVPCHRHLRAQQQHSPRSGALCRSPAPICLPQSQAEYSKMFHEYGVAKHDNMQHNCMHICLSPTADETQL